MLFFFLTKLKLQNTYKKQQRKRLIMAAERFRSNPELEARLVEVCLSGDDKGITSVELRRLYKSITNLNVAVRARRADLIDTLCLLYYQIKRPSRMGPEALGGTSLPHAPVSTPHVFSEDDEDYDQYDEQQKESKLEEIMNNNVNVDDSEEGVFDGPQVPPGILYIRLDPAHDPLKALVRQDDLLAKIQSVCKHYVTSEFVISSFEQLMRDLNTLNYKSIAHVIFLTHGSPHGLQVGANEMLQDEGASFDMFVNQLKRLLMPRASVLLTACLVGKYDGVHEDTPNALFSVSNDSTADCFANNLATRLGHEHEVYATSKVQIAGELVMMTRQEYKEEEACSVDNYKPYSFGYISEQQSMQVFATDKTRSTARSQVW
jgi:hypothetical protein